MSRSGRIAPSLALAVLAVAALAAVAASRGPAADADRALVVADADTGERLATVSVETGSTVTLAYTHSVEKTPVRDVYRVEGRSLRNVRMVFHSYGAGLPADAPIERTADGAFVVTPNRSYERLVVSPGERAGHVLVVDGERYDLVALSDGEAVALTVANGERGLPVVGTTRTSDSPISPVPAERPAPTGVVAP